MQPGSVGKRQHLVINAVLGAEATDELLRLAQVVARERGKQVVLNLTIQAASEPECRRGERTKVAV